MESPILEQLTEGVCIAWTEAEGHDELMHTSPFLHIANILYLASYSVRDILWLRVLTVAAMISIGWCYLCHGETGAVYWQSAFLAINLVQIGILLMERRPVKLTEDQQKMHNGPLRNLSPRQVQRFTSKAEWSTVRAGEVLLEEDSQLESLILVLSGRAKVIADGKYIADLGEGQFAGEMSFLTGGTTTAQVVADSTVLVAKWSEKYVTDLMQKDQDLGQALQASLGSDVVRKLIKSREKN